MRKGFKLSLLASALMVAGGSAFAAPGAPTGFGQWTADSSAKITHDCESGSGATGYTGPSCSVVVEDTAGGFKQLMFDDGNGNTFIGTFVADKNALGTGGAGGRADTLGFADESYVRMVMTTGSSTGNNGNGISAQQRLFENGRDGTVFESKTNIETMTITAADGTVSRVSSDAPIAILQGLKNAGATGDVSDDFVSNFNYSAEKNLTTDQQRTGFRMELDQVAGLGANGGKVGDVQSFTLREVAGSYLNTANNATVAINMPGAINPNTSASNPSLEYTSGDDIKMVWVGQNVDLSASGGIGNSLGSQFGYLSYENVGDFASGNTTARSEVMAKFSLAGISTAGSEWTKATTDAGSASTWDTVFNLPIGAAGNSSSPTLTDPDGNAANN